MTTKTPATAVWLGTAGLIPFVTGALYLTLGPLIYAQVVFNALIGYGAIILSFMGAVHWGLALRATESEAPGYWFCVSVVPSLVGWAAVLVALFGGHLIALILLAAGFIGVYLLDLSSISQGIAPPWYRKLRLPLTVVVVSCLGIASTAFV